MNQIVNKVVYGTEERPKDKYSIVDCAHNLYLNPEYDPFDMLAIELSLKTYNEIRNE
jgi:hypothetical protein